MFAGGALLAFAVMVWPHDPVEVQAYWNAGGMAHAFWYSAAASLGCVGYGSVFLAVGLYTRNPIVPAALLLAWEGSMGNAGSFFRDGGTGCGCRDINKYQKWP